VAGELPPLVPLDGRLGMLRTADQIHQQAALLVLRVVRSVALLVLQVVQEASAQAAMMLVQ
jgi:hypothetical protein